MACCVCRASNDRVSLTFDDKSKEIDKSPTIVDTLTRSPANPSMVCVRASVHMCVCVCVCVNFNWTVNWLLTNFMTILNNFTAL